MTRITTKQARALGILPGPAPKKQKTQQYKKNQKKTRAQPKVQLPVVQWDVTTFPGGFWLQVPFVPPSLNVWKNWHWAKQGRYKQELYNAIRLLKLAAKLPKYELATVQIIYYHRTNRRRDPADNWAPKFLMDALVAGGVLVDDNGELVDVQPVGMKVDMERPRTEVFVWGRR